MEGVWCSGVVVSICGSRLVGGGVWVEDVDGEEVVTESQRKGCRSLDWVGEGSYKRVGRSEDWCNAPKFLSFFFFF